MALLPGPRGDVTQVGVAYAGLDVTKFTMISGIIQGNEVGIRGWAIRDYALALEAQKGLDAAIVNGTYALLVRQEKASVLLGEKRLTSGMGQSNGVAPPTLNYSLSIGSFSSFDQKCLDAKVVLDCPNEPAAILAVLYVGLVNSPVFGSC